MTSVSTSAIDAMRRLAAGIDAPVEDLLEAHAFTVVDVRGTAEGGVASFQSAGEEPWVLTASVPVGSGLPQVRLVKSAGETEVVAMAIVVDGRVVPTLGQAVGLALSVSGFFEQLQPAA
jgi:hypothetical protein